MTTEAAPSDSKPAGKRKSESVVIPIRYVDMTPCIVAATHAVFPPELTSLMGSYLSVIEHHPAFGYPGNPDDFMTDTVVVIERGMMYCSYDTGQYIAWDVSLNTPPIIFGPPVCEQPPIDFADCEYVCVRSETDGLDTLERNHRVYPNDLKIPVNHYGGAYFECTASLCPDYTLLSPGPVSDGSVIPFGRLRGWRVADVAIIDALQISGRGLADINPNNGWRLMTRYPPQSERIHELTRWCFKEILRRYPEVVAEARKRVDGKVCYVCASNSVRFGENVCSVCETWRKREHMRQAETSMLAHLTARRWLTKLV